MERDAAFTQLASLLHIPVAELFRLERGMARVTGKEGVVESLVEENTLRALRICRLLGLAEDATMEEVQEALLGALRRSDTQLYELFQKPDGATPGGFHTLFDCAYDLAHPPSGFFLKEERVREALRRYHPRKILAALGYASVDVLLQRENLSEIFAALRVVEGAEWLNTTFFKAYETLTPDDFETRPIRTMVLGEKWLQIAKRFAEKKFHNVSHLKEFGLIFVIPDRIDMPGETLRVFSLLGHYLYEVSFYARLMRSFCGRADFAARIIALFRGDVPRPEAADPDGRHWLIVQRYLAKEDERHPLLSTPHVNPEALHWKRAERVMAGLHERFPFVNLDFWCNLDFVGDFFPSARDGSKQLVSFDLLDNVMSLVAEKQGIRYGYHRPEALWNELFCGFVGGEEQLEDLLLRNFVTHVIDLGAPRS